MKYNLKIIGNFFGSDGYSSHTRQLFNALANRKDTNMKIETQLPQDWMKQVNDNELHAIMKEDDGKFDNIIITMPQMWQLFTGLNKNYAFVVWEGDRVPLSWIEEFLNPKIDLIFVPSVHTYTAVLSTTCLYGKGIENDQIIQDKLRVIPHGVDKSIFHSQRKKDNDEAQNVSLSGDTKKNQRKKMNNECKTGNSDNHADTNNQQDERAILRASQSKSNKRDMGNPADIFTFICNKGWRGTNWDRGGVQYLLKAFAEEFRKDEKVQLILKLNPSYINPQHIGQAIQQLNLPEDRAQININCDLIPFDKLPLLYRQADCFVCATRAESFNLPGLEAMACGLPVIQTLFGGQIDYMMPDNSRGITYKLSESEEKPMYEGIQWATPDITRLREELRWAFENQDKIKEMGKQAEEDSKNWTWDKGAKKIIDSIK